MRELQFEWKSYLKRGQFVPLHIYTISRVLQESLAALHDVTILLIIRLKVEVLAIYVLVRYITMQYNEVKKNEVIWSVHILHVSSILIDYIIRQTLYFRYVSTNISWYLWTFGGYLFLLFLSPGHRSEFLSLLRSWRKQKSSRYMRYLHRNSLHVRHYL